MSQSWEQVRQAEQSYLRAQGGQRRILRARYIKRHRLFSKQLQREKRIHWRKTQDELLQSVHDSQHTFWQKINNIDKGQHRTVPIPMEVKLEDGSISCDRDIVMCRWETTFSNLLNPSPPDGDLISPKVAEVTEYLAQDSGVDTPDRAPELNATISLFEVAQAVGTAHLGKATGVDNIPSEVVRNPTMVSTLHDIFNYCFKNGVVPSSWTQSVICPIPKSASSDSRDPLNYRGISLNSSICKMYSSILNKRLSKWSEVNNIVTDCQNGFRKGRSTIDQINTIITIVEKRKSQHKSTFAAFIDLRKAYDCVNRSMLWFKLREYGVSGNMYQSLKAMYIGTESRLRINAQYSNWFNVSAGLKQGCILSPLLFNLFINDLAETLTQTGVGIPIGDKKMPVLMYADDLVVLAQSDDELQLLLNTLHKWCKTWQLEVNSTKSAVIHFRPQSFSATHHNFICGDESILLKSDYRYLGIIINEFLNFNVTVKAVALSAHRALGKLISKIKINGGVPYECFVKLYNCLVWSVVNYGASVWGNRSYPAIEAVHNRACRFYLGLGQHAPTAAARGDMGLIPPLCKQRVEMTRQYHRLIIMSDNRLNKSVFIWAGTSSGIRQKSWPGRVGKFLKELGIEKEIECCNSKQEMISLVRNNCICKCVSDWHSTINRETGRRGVGGNKLRTYRQFKDEYGVEQYVIKIKSVKERSALSKFRIGVAPINLELGRYLGIPVNNRFCNFCENCVEDEKHVLLSCPMYNGVRQALFTQACYINSDFMSYDEDAKLRFLFNDDAIVSKCAKTCLKIINIRSNVINYVR